MGPKKPATSDTRALVCRKDVKKRKKKDIPPPSFTGSLFPVYHDNKFKSDKQSLRDILINLLNNAVKYSKEHGRIILSSRVTKNFLILEIKDFGYGIEKANIKRIFDRFYRTAKARANTKGTGLGLTLVNQLVKRIGGEISVESSIGKGSTFFIKFPFKTVK